MYKLLSSNQSLDFVDHTNYIAQMQTKGKCTKHGGSLVCPAEVALEELRNSPEIPKSNILHAKIRCQEASDSTFWHTLITYPNKDSCRCDSCKS